MVFLGGYLRNLVCVWFLDKQTLRRKEQKNYLREGGEEGEGGRGGGEEGRKGREGGEEGRKGREGGRERGKKEGKENTQLHSVYSNRAVQWLVLLVLCSIFYSNDVM